VTGALRRALSCGLVVLVGACGDPGADRARPEPASGDDGRADVVDHAVSVPPDSAVHSLRWGGTPSGVAYRPVRDTATLRAGVLVGRISTANDVVGDSAITPTHDLDVCHPFTETHVPAQDRGVGNAVVWLAGVATGPMVDAPRRATLTLDRCQLAPRVQRMATGGTLQVASRDAMSSRLRFVDVDDEQSIRTQVDLNDAGQLVPTSAVSEQPGLVAVRDDRHPWVRAYIAVAAHPFVAVTTADGTFRFGAVPPGRYTLVVWQEQLGVRTRAVRVTTGVETRVRVEY
jgi:hypothetical protein